MKPLMIAAALAFTPLGAVPANSVELDTPAAYAEEEYAHPMNDAWMGMPVETRDGTLIGFVMDAPVDANGDIAEVIVDTGNSALTGLNRTLIVRAKDAELLETHVEIELTGLHAQRM
jgi:hypothetical protein